MSFGRVDGEARPWESSTDRVGARSGLVVVEMNLEGFLVGDGIGACFLVVKERVDWHG